MTYPVLWNKNNFVLKNNLAMLLFFYWQPVLLSNNYLYFFFNLNQLSNSLSLIKLVIKVHKFEWSLIKIFKKTYFLYFLLNLSFTNQKNTFNRFKKFTANTLFKQKLLIINFKINFLFFSTLRFKLNTFMLHQKLYYTVKNFINSKTQLPIFNDLTADACVPRQNILPKQKNSASLNKDAFFFFIIFKNLFYMNFFIFKSIAQCFYFNFYLLYFTLNFKQLKFNNKNLNKQNAKHYWHKKININCDLIFNGNLRYFAYSKIIIINSYFI